MRATTILGIVAALAAAATAAYASPGRGTVDVRATTLGRVLVDARGRTLYLFQADRSRKSTCYGACAAAWPPLLTTGAPLAGPGVSKGLLATTKRRDGRLQVVYAGHPLYFFSADTRAGQVTGEDVDHFGGRWYAVDAKGAKVEPAKETGTTTTTGGGGYGRYGP